MNDLPQESLVDMRLSRVIIRDGGEQQWIYLAERGGDRGFTIVIGSAEAREIHRVVTRLEPPRPMTHQLTFNAIEALGAEIKHIEIVDLRDNTFYARVVLERDGESLSIDARPSDALALALRAECPIRVAESVLQQARTDSSLDALPDELPDDLLDGTEDDLDVDLDDD